MTDGDPLPLEDWALQEFPESDDEQTPVDRSGWTEEQILAWQDEHNCEVDPTPDPIRKFVPTDMFLTFATPCGSAKEVPALFIGFRENVGYTVLYTRHELSRFFAHFYNPKNRKEYVDFLDKVREHLPRIRPTQHSRIYDTSREIRIRLDW